jgi:hypothetical protein
VPHFTETRIRKLCGEAVAVKDDDVERVVNELRSALEEHIRLAKESLSAQAAAISMLDSERTA